MKRPVWLALGAVLAVMAVWFVLRPRTEGDVQADLIEQFPNAVDKRPAPAVFSITDATIGGQTHRAILVKESSRLVYSVKVPERGEFRVSLGILEEGWTVPGDGVLFRILVAPPHTPPEEVLNQPINPYGTPTDRRWHDVTINLDEYAGETVDIYLNTNASPPKQPPVSNTAGDFAVWGTPRVVIP